MLAHLESLEHLAHAQRNVALSRQPALGARRSLPNRLQFAFGRLQERLAFAPPLVGQWRIVTGNQPLVWISRRGEFDEVRVDKAPEVQRAAVNQRPDRRVTQR